MSIGQRIGEILHQLKTLSRIHFFKGYVVVLVRFNFLDKLFPFFFFEKWILWVRMRFYYSRWFVIKQSIPQSSQSAISSMSFSDIFIYRI